jgi:alginate O-acetyltransferase complex protein AlgJ
VLPAPLKPSLEPHRLTSRYTPADAPVQNPSYHQWLREMADAGVAVADFSDELAEVERATGEPQFLRTDTHWTPEAMERVTARLAEFIRKSRLLPDAPAAGYQRQDVRVSGTGDIAEMLKLPKDQTLYPPQEITVHRVLSADGEPWKRNRQADVLVLGDSFCNVYSMKEMTWGDAAGFCEQLSYELQRPLDKIALNAGGS